MARGSSDAFCFMVLAWFFDFFDLIHTIPKLYTRWVDPRENIGLSMLMITPRVFAFGRRMAIGSGMQQAGWRSEFGMP